MRLLLACLTLGACCFAAAASDLDALIERDVAARGEELPTAASDAAFMRRVYLDAIGRIPSVEEARRFLDSAANDKRSRLIDELLASDGYVKHWFHFWADLLRVSTDGDVTRSGIVGSAYTEWIQRALQNNVPYDQFVRDLVARQGNIWEPENAGAVGFYERDFGMELDHFSSLMRVFAGTRMECAQCHDHPFDRWTQKDFYQMAAFTHDVRAGKYPAIYEAIKGPERNAINVITVPMRFASVLPRPYPLKLPHDYAYDDAKPFQVVTAETVFGEKVTAQADRNGAELFADWLTSPENPRFTRVIVNRLWSQLFGASLAPPPLDDLRDDTQAWNPDLENALIGLMEELNYDQRGFLAKVMKSKAYQRRCLTEEYQPGASVHFAAPFLRRMSAEQAWDSLITLIVDDPERPMTRRQIYRTRYLADLRNRASKIDGNPERVAAWLRSSEGRQFVAARGREKVLEAEAEIKVLQEAADREFAALDRLKSTLPNRSADFAVWKSLHHELYRASELESPAPPGHFLRTFGQSDRMQISNANQDASVPQALASMNGELTAGVTNPFSHLSRAAHQVSEPQAQLKTLCLGILGRLPTDDEAGKLMPHLKDSGGVPFISGVLLNCTEFLFIQ